MLLSWCFRQQALEMHTNPPGLNAVATVHCAVSIKAQLQTDSGHELPPEPPISALFPPQLKPDTGFMSGSEGKTQQEVKQNKNFRGSST